MFAKGFESYVTAEILTGVLESKLGPGTVVTCEKLDLPGRRGKFKVAIECDHPEMLHNPALWPKGAFFQRWYEPRQQVAAGAATKKAGGVTSPSPSH